MSEDDHYTQLSQSPQ